MKNFQLILGTPQRIVQLDRGRPAWILACRLSGKQTEELGEIDQVEYGTNVSSHFAHGKLKHGFLGQIQVCSEVRGIDICIVRKEGPARRFHAKYRLKEEPQSVRLLPDTERANFNFTMPELIIIMPLVDAQRQQISIDLRTWITRISEWHFPKKTTSERPFVADPDRTDEDHNEWDRATVMRHAKRLIDHGLIIRPPEGRRKQPWRVSRRAMNLVNALAASNLPQRRDNSY